LKEHSAQAKAVLTANGLLVGASRLFTVVNYDAMANMWHANKRSVMLTRHKLESMNGEETQKKFALKGR
jgi:hypothetical protein